MSDERPKQYSLNWRQDPSGKWSAGFYIIETDGWHDTTKRNSRWVLRYRDTVIHTSSPLANSAVDECMRAADWHRGVGSKP